MVIWLVVAFFGLVGLGQCFINMKLIDKVEELEEEIKDIKAKGRF